MKKNDDKELGVRLIRMFAAVYDTGSITAAARRLEVTQSTVSHGLNRLRGIVKDELFVPMGRGISPTPRAAQLFAQAQHILEAVDAFTEPAQYEPRDDSGQFVIAANDYETEIVLKPLFHALRHRAPKVQLRIWRAQSQQDWAELLRNGQVDLVLAPELTGTEADLMQKLILTDNDLCYFDPDHVTAPDTIAAYCALPHAVMMPGQHELTAIDLALSHLERHRRVSVTLPGFSAIASLIRGTNTIATMPARLKDNIFAGFAHCSPPVDLPPDRIAQIWHMRQAASPRHQWLRALISEIATAR